MRKSTIFSLAAVFGCLCGSSANAQTYMEAATLDYPSGFYASFAPSSVSVTYDNQPIELVNPHLNDWGEECVDVFIKLGDEERQTVTAVVMSSFGNPEDPDDPDIWLLDVALYELEDLWSFEGDIITVEIPEGVVANQSGDINPAQELVFYLVPTLLDYTVTPESGETVGDSDLTVKISFGGNPIERLQAEVRAMTYEPAYRDIALEFGKEVTLSDDNEIVISLASLESGEYELVVPEGYVLVTENDQQYLSPDIWLEYTVENNGQSGIASVISSGEGVSVHTIQGHEVLRKADSKDITRLPAGIYIVNGKKILVRK